MVRSSMAKIPHILLAALSLIFAVSIYSHVLDPDFGWHLRFGKELWESRQFNYLDTYSWPNYGQPWTNHEWGGDLLFWIIYDYLGYFPLLMLTAILPLAAFWLASKIFRPKTSLTSVIVCFVLLWSVQHILMLRLAMFTPLFFAVLWYLLEKFPRQKNHYLWPPLLWLWSLLHGSWVLGFIVIAIYILGHSFNLLLKKYCPQYWQAGLWNWRDISQAALWSALSALLICLNPYGPKIWQEVLNYFAFSYYKTHIIEWLASYTYPVYWRPLLIAAIAIPLTALAFLKRRLTWPQLLLFAAFFYSGWQYKRNMMLFVLLCAPLFVLYSDEVGKQLLKIKNIRTLLDNRISRRFSSFFLTAGTLILILNYGAGIRFSNNVWADEALLAENLMPSRAVEFLSQKTGGDKTYIFNEYRWGGYFNWTLPNALVYLDGRGPATWRIGGENALEHYQKIKYQKGGLEELTDSPVQYIILADDSRFISQPDWVNRLIFSAADWQKILTSLAVPPSQLEIDLEKSQDWEPMYEDRLSRIWRRAP